MIGLNAVPLGSLAGAVRQFLAIGALIFLKSPVLVIAGFVPVFFDNAAIAVYANNKSGLKATRMKYLSYAGFAIVVIVLLDIPQLQYRADKEGYFLMTEDWEVYKELKAKQAK